MKDYSVDPSFTLIKEAEADLLDEFEEYEAEWERRGSKMDAGIFPLQVNFELNTTCNLKCIMCVFSSNPPVPEYMSPDLAKRVINEGADKGLASLKLQYRGEPLLYPRIEDIVKYAKDKGILKVMFNTNATLLTEDTAIALIDAGIDKIICSIDSSVKETYEAVRVGARFETIVKNLINLRKQMQHKGAKKPIIRIQAVKQDLNCEEIESGKYTKFWSEIADEVAFEDELEAKGHTRDTTPLPDWHCGQLWQRVFILANGDVLPCCAAINLNTHEPYYVLGNIKDQSLEEIWKSRRIEWLRRMHKDGDSHRLEMCWACRLRKNVIDKVKADET